MGKQDKRGVGAKLLAKLFRFAHDLGRREIVRTEIQPLSFETEQDTLLAASGVG